MAKNRTEKSNFQSNYGGEWCTAAHYLVEIICEKIAKKDGNSLPNKFWNVDKWKKTYRHQIIAANGLLKMYDAKAIMKAIRHPKAKTVYSYGAHFILVPLIEIEQEQINQLKLNPTEIQEVDITEKPKVMQKKKSRFANLDG